MGLLPGQDHPYHGVEYGAGAVADRSRARHRSRDEGAIGEDHRQLEKTAARYEDEPATHEGRKQLSERAKQAEEKRENALARYHQYEIASAAFQIGIVLASAEVITAMAILGWFSGVAGLIGIGFMALGLWAPHALDFLTHAAH